MSDQRSIPPHPPSVDDVDPASLRIVHYPAEVLRQRTEIAPEPGPAAAAVAERMIALMRDAPGIGLAAPQVGLPWRMFVAHVPPPPPEDAAADDDGEPLFVEDDAGNRWDLFTAEPEAYIDPVVRGYSKDLEPFEEGCLSLPEVTGTVRRPSAIEIEYTTPTGERKVRRAAGLLARCWQHEIDHLDGVLIIDKFSPLDRRKAKRELEELEARAGLW